VNPLQTQPVAISELVKQAISNAVKLLVVFGLVTWSAEQTAIVLIVVDSFLALAVGIWTYRKVTPTAAPVLPGGTTVRVQGSEETIDIPSPVSA
jgi:hypothetical protein